MEFHTQYGLFEDETDACNEYTYSEFITQGAKKYAYTKYVENSKIEKKLKQGKKINVIEKGNEKTKILEITVAGVPKVGANCLKKISDFRDNLVFSNEITNKNSQVYNENQAEIILKDYKGKTMLIKEKYSCCIIPANYTLGKSEEYANLLCDESAKRSIYIE